MTAKKETVVDTILEAIYKTSGDIDPLPKTEKNKHGDYMFAPIDLYYERIAPIALMHGLYWIGKQTGYEGLSEKYVAFKYTYDLHLRSGEKWEGFYTTTIIHPIQGAQTSSSADSYAEKAFMRRTFKVITGEKDPEAVSAERKSVVGITKLKEEYREFCRDMYACSDLDELVALRNSSLDFLERAPEYEHGWYGDNGDVTGLQKDLDKRYRDLKEEQDRKQGITP